MIMRPTVPLRSYSISKTTDSAKAGSPRRRDETSTWPIPRSPALRDWPGARAAPHNATTAASAAGSLRILTFGLPAGSRTHLAWPRGRDEDTCHSSETQDSMPSPQVANQSATYSPWGQIEFTRLRRLTPCGPNAAWSENRAVCRGAEGQCGKPWQRSKRLRKLHPNREQWKSRLARAGAACWRPSGST